MAELQRLTTEYSAAEDRIRLTGEDRKGATLTLWLTRRLLDRLVAHLVLWLEQHHADVPRRDVLLEFAQQAAVGQLPAQAPVRVTSAQTCLIDSVDITPDAEQVRLNFKSGNDLAAGVSFDPTQLRQWLAILHQAYRTADWPLTPWPAWMAESRPTTGMASAAVLH